MDCVAAGPNGSHVGLSLVREWMQMPGVSLALDVGMRHMGSSEPTTSMLRSSALRFIMIDCHVFERGWLGTFCSSSSSPQPFLTLYITLFKSVRLELAEGPSTTANGTRRSIGGLAPPFAKRLCNEIRRFTSIASVAWQGKDVTSCTTDLGKANDCNASKGDVLRGLQGWLQLQLVLMRSWVLLWHQILSMDTKTYAVVYEAMSLRPVPVLTKLIADFRTECEISEGDSLISAALEACGFNSEVAERMEDDAAGGAARWERFAFSHLRGRVLPGCSHWACTNLAGFSEAALPTQLCSGCRRARYCSLKCQKEAWVDGGHREVCRECNTATIST